MIFRSCSHFLGIYLNRWRKENKPKKDFGRWAGSWPNGNSARYGDLLRWPSPWLNGRSAQAKVSPHGAVHGHRTRGSHGGAADNGAPAEEVWRGHPLWHQWRMVIAPSMERGWQSSQGGVTLSRRRRRLGVMVLCVGDGGAWPAVVLGHSNTEGEGNVGQLELRGMRSRCDSGSHREPGRRQYFGVISTRGGDFESPVQTSGHQRGRGGCRCSWSRRKSSREDFHTAAIDAV
jgi:hypothetical protein